MRKRFLLTAATVVLAALLFYTCKKEMNQAMSHNHPKPLYYTNCWQTYTSWTEIYTQMDLIAEGIVYENYNRANAIRHDINHDYMDIDSTGDFDVDVAKVNQSLTYYNSNGFPPGQLSDDIFNHKQTFDISRYLSYQQCGFEHLITDAPLDFDTFYTFLHAPDYDSLNSTWRDTATFLVVPMPETNPSGIYGYWCDNFGTIHRVVFPSMDALEADTHYFKYILDLRNIAHQKGTYTTSTNCSETICDDGHCDVCRGEDSTNCYVDCNHNVNTDLHLDEVTVLKDDDPQRESWTGGAYEIYFSAMILHANGTREYFQQWQYDKFKRRDIEICKKSGRCKGTSTAHDVGITLSQTFNPETDVVFIMFYEKDPTRHKDSVQYHYDDGVNIADFVLYYHSVDAPFGDKDNFFYPETSINHEHVVVIHGGEFVNNSTPTNTYQGGEYTYTGGLLNYYGLAFKMHYNPHQ